MKSLNELLNTFWGSVVTSLIYDPLLHQVVILVETEDAGIRSNFKLTFLKVFTLNIFTDDPGNTWDYLELTSINAKKTRDKVEIYAELWTSESGFKILCEELLIKEVDPKNI